MPQTTATALTGGALYGLSAGVFGVGGAARGAFLAAYDLPKEVHIFTAGAIGLAVDTGRLVTYWSQGAQLDPRLLWGLLLFVPVSFAGAKVAERTLARIPQERFRAVVAIFLGLVGLKLLLLPSEGVGAKGMPEGRNASRRVASGAQQPLGHGGGCFVAASLPPRVRLRRRRPRSP